MRTTTRQTKHWIPVALLSGAALVLLAAAPRGMDVIEYDEAELFFEQNATDGDLGLHFKVDGEGWERTILMNPQHRRLVDVRVGGNLGHVIGLTELFSESAEPPFTQIPPGEFLDLFPEGEYRFVGRTLEGDSLVGTATLTHDLPGEVVLLSPEEDEEVEADEDLTVEWELLADPNPPESVIEFYEVVVEKDEDDERLRVFTVHMLPTESSVRVPEEFLEEDKDYKVEIIAQETSGNRTAIEVPFETDD